MKKIGLYLHIPFCESKCPYCDFYSNKSSELERKEYLKKLIDIARNKNNSNNYKAETIYIGGGTPSLLGTENIYNLIEEIKSAYFYDDGEITLEINPESGQYLDYKKLYKSGINRLSIGLQSAVDSELKLLGRLHNSNLAKKVVTIAQESGYKNISLDLMVGLSGQTLESLDYSIDYCNSLNVQHISCYLLKREKGTPYFENKNKLIFPDDDMQSDYYLHMCKRLSNYGYQHYEISNFSKPGYESAHNMKYWNCEEYLGLGPSAHSYLNGQRFYYPRNTSEFYNDNIINDGQGGSEEEYIMLKLRLSDGLVFSEYENKFKKPFPKEYIKNSIKYKEYINLDDEKISLNDKGFLVSNYLICQILYGG